MYGKYIVFFFSASTNVVYEAC